jgi:hypothetical protein
MQPSHGSGKRRSPRYFFFASAELTEEDSQVRVPSRVSELSLHGCYLDMMNPFPADTVFTPPSYRLSPACLNLGFQRCTFSLGLTLRLPFVVTDLQSLCENSCGSGGHDFTRAACGCPTTRL